MKKKQGFTLVELLAVIAILAILIIIALPNILKLYNEAQMKLFLQEAQNINKAAKDSFLSYQIGSTSPTETIYTYIEGEESTVGNIKINITGKKPENGELIIRANGDTALAFHNGKYCAIKLWGSDEITITKVTSDECFIDNSSRPERCFEFDSSTGTITGYYDYEGNNSSNPACSRDVIIPSVISGVPVTTIGFYSFSLSPDPHEEAENPLISVIIPDSVTTIEDSAFYNNKITTVTIPDSVTYIGAHTFRDNLLTVVTIPNNLISIGMYAFRDNQLTTITIPNSVTNIENYAFMNNQLTSVFIIGKSSSYSFGGSNIWGWASGYNDSNIIWNAS